MAEIDCLAYVVIAASDLDAWEKYGTGVLGMTVGSRTAGALGLRMDAQPWRIMVERGEADDLHAAGWAVADDAALDSYVAAIGSRGIQVIQEPAELASARDTARLFSFVDPNGVRHELSVRAAPDTGLAPFASDVLRGPGFSVGELGIGHILPVARDYEESVAFYGDKMGLRYSDRIRQEMAPGVYADATFWHTRTGRHHSLATGQFPSPKKLNHLMLEYLSMDDVGAAYDRATAAGVPIILELGHHPNDRMFSFYMVTPSGFGLELGHGGIVIDDADWEPRIYDRMSDWGHRRNIQTIAA